MNTPTEQQVADILNRYVFEPNTKTVRARIADELLTLFEERSRIKDETSSEQVDESVLNYYITDSEETQGIRLLISFEKGQIQFEKNTQS